MSTCALIRSAEKTTGSPSGMSPAAVPGLPVVWNPLRNGPCR